MTNPEYAKAKAAVEAARTNLEIAKRRRDAAQEAFHAADRMYSEEIHLTIHNQICNLGRVSKQGTLLWTYEKPS